MASPASPAISYRRSLAAAGAMTSAAAGVAYHAVRHISFEWPLLGFAGLLALAGVGLTQRSLVAQVLSRATAWLVLLPSFLASVVGLMHGAPPALGIFGLAGATGAALVAATPMLHTKEARQAFDPKSFRRVLLAGSTASVATALVAGAIALEAARHAPVIAAAFGALAAALVASAIGVVRMRGWGILLGALTSFVLLAAALVLQSGASLALVLAACPPLLLHLLPVLYARFRGTPPDERVRVAEVTAAVTRVRVAAEPTEGELEAPAAEDARALRA